MFQRMSRRSILNLLALNLQSILSTTADLVYSDWLHKFLSRTYGTGPIERGWLVMVPLLEKPW